MQTNDRKWEKAIYPRSSAFICGPYCLAEATRRSQEKQNWPQMNADERG